MNTNIFFEPWVGEHYWTPYSIFKNNILVLGDSHYCDVCDSCGDRDKHPGCTTFTHTVVKDYLNPNHKADWKKTQSTFINSVYGHQTTIKERCAYYASVAFYNYLQVSAGDNPYSTNQYNYRVPSYLSAFYEVLDRIMPDVVVVWGDQVWDTLPNNWNYGDADGGAPVSINNTLFRRYLYYPYKDKRILLIGTHHPSQGYDRQLHHAVFMQFGAFEMHSIDNALK